MVVGKERWLWGKNNGRGGKTMVVGKEQCPWKKKKNAAGKNDGLQRHDSGRSGEGVV